MYKRHTRVASLLLIHTQIYYSYLLLHTHRLLLRTGKWHPRVASVLLALGGAYQRLGSWRAALARYKDAYLIFRYSFSRVLCLMPYASCLVPYGALIVLARYTDAHLIVRYSFYLL